MSNQQDSKSIFKEWLEKLQQESWQLELLISGFAIFGIYQSRTVITDLEFMRSSVLDDSGVLLGILVFIIKKGWLIFFINLLFHVILRGLWIGAIGLRYVSQDIDYDKFAYSDIFNRFLRKSVGSYDDFIERLEKVCSVIFAYTFLLFLLFMSFMLFLTENISIAMVIQKLYPGSMTALSVSGWVALLFFGLGSMVFFDLISLGGFKKIKNQTFSKIYFYIYRFYGFITLSFLYRPLLYNFIDNAYTKRLFYLSIPYIIIVGFGDSMITNIKNPFKPDRNYMLSEGLLLDENFYDDLRITRLDEFPNEERKVNKKQLSWISMEQYEITKDLSSFFIKMDRKLYEFMGKDSTISAYYKTGFVFSLFNAHLKDDAMLNEIRENKKVKLEDLYSLRRKINKELRTNDNDEKVLKTRLDSIKQKIANIEADFEKQIIGFKYNKSLKVKNAYLSAYQFYIDTAEIKLKESYFFNHPHYGEEGIKCYFVTDSLAKGVHQFKVIRKYLDSDEKISKDSIILPFIKI
jgi:hypothetical protein